MADPPLTILLARLNAMDDASRNQVLAHLSAAEANEVRARLGLALSQPVAQVPDAEALSPPYAAHLARLRSTPATAAAEVGVSEAVLALVAARAASAGRSPGPSLIDRMGSLMTRGKTT
jgi:uncharacterized protein YciW